MAQTITDELMRQTLCSNVPPSTDADIRVDNHVLWFREKLSGRWTGLFVVIGY